MPFNETERLRNLRDYEILDTPADPAFNNLVNLAANVCNTPVAMISFVDENRQWFKASTGIKMREGPRDSSLCAYTILEKDFFVVEDALKDPRFYDAPFVQEPTGIRFYLGVPLITEEGHALGAICSVDRVARELNSNQIAALKMLAQQVVYLLKKQRMESKTHSRQTIKFAALGQVAANIAHEIRNPLTIIQAKAEYLLQQLTGAPLTLELGQKHLEKIIETTQRISTIIGGIQSFSRNSSEEPIKTLSLEKVIQDAYSLSDERFKSRAIRFLFTNAAPNAIVQGRQVQLAQVFLNLLNNSFDAIAQLSERWVKIGVEQDGDKLIVRVKDSGKGLPPTVVERLFMPFFTTKNEDQGTGLGLSISKEIIETHGGHISYDESDSNTCFVIQLPLARD